MAYTSRILENKLARLVQQFGAIVLTGPRQAGKTTLLKEVAQKCCPGLHYVAFDTPADVDNFRRDPDLFFANYSGPMFLDEVQHVPDIFPYVKQRIDEASGQFSFFLSGSQAYSLMQGVSESLAGRAAILDLWPFCALELRGGNSSDVAHRLDALEDPTVLEARQGQTFAINDQDDIVPRMLTGGYPPVALGQTDRDIWLDSYRRSYLERDIRGMGSVQDLGRFDRFLTLIAGRTGTVVNKAELSRTLQVDNKTIDHWLDLLKRGYQAYALQPWHANTTKRIVKRPKIHFADIGLALHLQGIRDAEGLRRSPQFGHLFESFVVMEVLKLYGHAARARDIFFWRTAQQQECDLVLSLAGRLVPIEIKHSMTISQRDLLGLTAFMNTYPKEAASGIVISLSPQIAKVHERTWNIPLGWLLSTGQ